MKYYVNFVEMTINGENRTQPRAYDNETEAMAYYHKTAGNDMASEQVVGYSALVWSAGEKYNNIIVNESWGTMERPTTEAEAE